MTSSRLLHLSAVLSVCLFSTALFAQKVGPTVRINGPINTRQIVTLKGTVHPFANALNDRGLAPQSMQLNRMHLILKRSPAQETALRQLIQEQNTPGSPNYHKWLTPAQFAAQFGPSKQDIAAVENWLSGQGFTVNKIEPGNQVLDISGTVAQLSSTFHTQIHKYIVKGQLHYANANNPSIPAALAPVVGGFVSLNNFHLKSYAQSLGKATYNPSTGQAKPSWTIGGGTFDYQNYNFVLSPADYAVQYDLTPLYSAGINGAGQTIAIVNESNINISLVNQFRTLFNLPANPPQVIIDGNDPGIDGINNPDGPNYASVEAYLDVEWAGAVAPAATIDLVIAADTSLESGLALAAEHAVYGDVAPVISLSFGQCELFNGSSNAFWNNLWQQAAAQGQTVIVSTGDSGSAGCDASSSQYASNGLAVNGLASTPYNVAVGGTDFFYSSYNQGSSAIDTQLGGYWSTTASNTTANVSLQKPIAEQPWNDSQYGLNLFDYYKETGSTTVAGGSGGVSSAAFCANNSYSTTTGLCTGTTSGYAKPAWQTGAGVPNDGVRDLPDVSLFAADGLNDSYYPICATDGDCQPASSGSIVQIFGVGGTSAAAPSFAGIMALVNQKYGRQGQANTILYPLKTQFPAAFHDVAQGTNSVPCEILPTASPNCISVTNALSVTVTDSTGASVNISEGQLGSGTTASYNASAGYNLATGLGSIDANQLVTNWANVKLASTSVTLTPSTATTFTHGTAFQFNGTVTGTTPTGDVAILTDGTENSQQGISNFLLDGSGNYSGSITNLPGGSYNIWASYGGDSKNASAVSASIPITVTPETSGIVLGLFANASNQYYTSASGPGSSVDYGTQLMLSARVAPAAYVSALQACTPSGSTTKCPSGYSAPTGTITFSDTASGSGLPATALLNAEGDAEFNAPFSVGSHSVSASYAGDSSYNTSTASPITFTVVKDTPVLNLYSSAYDSTNNALVTGTNEPNAITVEVSNGAQSPASSSTSTSCPSTTYRVPVAPPTGTVTLTSSLSGLSGTAQLQPLVDSCTGAVSGVATFTLPPGSYNSTYNISVSYAGDVNYSPLSASSNTFNVPIETSGTGITTQTTATMSSTTVSPNSTITIKGTVSATSGSTAPTGQVYVFSSGSYITYANLTAGSVTTAAHNTRKAALWPTAGGALLAAALFFWIPKRRRNWLAMFVMLAVLVSMSGIACGGGGSSSGSGGGGGGGGSTGSGGTANFTIVLNSQTLVQGANYLTLQYIPSQSSSFLPSAYNLNSGNPVSNPLSDFSLVPATSMAAVTAGSSTGTGVKINLSSVNGFSGSVNLTCSTASASGVSCTITPQSPSLSAGASTSAALSITAASGTAAGNYPVEITGKDSTGQYIHTLGVVASVR